MIFAISEEKVIKLYFELKLEKFWIVVSKIITFARRTRDRKRFFHSSRYDFWFPRYHRVKKKIIFLILFYFYSSRLLVLLF